jgi:hypothetical protein
LTKQALSVILIIEREVKIMNHNKWILWCFVCLMISAIPGGMGVMPGVLSCVACAGGCFVKWVMEEEKFQNAEYEKYLENLRKGA